MGLRGKTEPRVRAMHGAQLADVEGRKAPNGEPYDHRFIASTDRLASDRGVILASAWRLDGWLQRPRWIANHDIGGFSKLTEVALGRGVWAGIESGLPKEVVGPSGRALVAYVRYASTPFAREVRTLYQEGGLDDVSVRWDWRTEELREPTEDEVELYGRELAWVATRADLVEVSAVLLGADVGAQMLRGNVEAALERCRSAGHCMPQVERFLREHGHSIVPVTRADAEPDLMAAAGAVDQARTAVAEFEDWLERASQTRQQLAEATTAISNLVAAAQPDMPDVDEEPPPPSPDAVALDAWFSVLSGFDVAFGNVIPKVRAMGNALEQLAEALGVVPTGTEERFIDLDAVTQDAERQREGIVTVEIGGRDYAIDTVAIRRERDRQRPLDA